MLMALSLSSCLVPDPVDNGLAVIKREGATLLIAPCVAVPLDMVLVEEVSRSGGETVVWFASGLSYHLDMAQVLSSDPVVTPPFPGEERAAPPLEPGSSVRVYLRDIKDGGVSAMFTIPNDGFSESQWLGQDGGPIPEACEVVIKSLG
jgi:hypothetical protein